MSVTAYDVVRSENPASFDGMVDAKIAAGFQPYGPLIIRDKELIQAFVQGAPVTADDQFDDTSVLARLDALEATVNTAVTGLSAVAADHETRIDALEV